ncbi:histone-lysine N-methyltransferase EHMT1-like protein [Aphelenchoides avenae]|nr:histone-lysine N-methyltransferase EHMT1-like protein [Aphelenchus avenae]
MARMCAGDEDSDDSILDASVTVQVEINDELLAKVSNDAELMKTGRRNAAVRRATNIESVDVHLSASSLGDDSEDTRPRRYQLRGGRIADQAAAAPKKSTSRLVRAATFMKQKFTGKTARGALKPHTGQKEPAPADDGLLDLENGMRRLDLSKIAELETNFRFRHEPLIDPKAASKLRKPKDVKGCRCMGECDPKRCECAKNMKYRQDNGLLKKSCTGKLFECSGACGCKKHCGNRATQRDPLRTAVVETKNKGYGLQALEPAMPGQFIGIYIITSKQAEKLSAQYAFNLADPDGNVSFVMDASETGNDLRFLNHSCDANVRAVLVYRHDQDLRIPCVAFFALRDICAGEELTLNYFAGLRRNVAKSFLKGETADNGGFVCKCGSDKCLGRF